MFTMTAAMHDDGAMMVLAPSTHCRLPVGHHGVVPERPLTRREIAELG